MTLTSRPYQGDSDFWRIRAFLREVLPLNSFHMNSWHLARFDYWWWHVNKNIHMMRPEEVIWLWEDANNKIAALLIPDSPGEGFINIHPAYHRLDLQEEMIITAQEKLARVDSDGKRHLRIWVEEHDIACGDALAREGYAKGLWPESMRTRTLEAPITPVALAPGYAVRPMGDGLELLDRCYASGLAFHANDIQYAVNNRNDVTWYRNIQTAPLYRRDLDIVAIAPDGSVTSFCTVWFDDITRTGVFEPVATVPAHQRRGLGKAVMAEGLRRLQRMGATRAYVSSYSVEAGALYASMGFTDYDLLVPWEK